MLFDNIVILFAISVERKHASVTFEDNEFQLVFFSVWRISHLVCQEVLMEGVGYLLMREIYMVFSDKDIYS